MKKNATLQQKIEHILSSHILTMSKAPDGKQYRASIFIRDEMGIGSGHGWDKPSLDECLDLIIIFIEESKKKPKDRPKTPTLEFISKKTSMSPALFGILKAQSVSRIEEKMNKPSKKKPLFPFIEDITEREFRKVRGAADKAWEEFVKLRGY